MVAFKTSFNNQQPLDWFKMKAMTTRDKMSTIVYGIYMPCEWRGHMVSDPRTSLFIVIEGNGFSKLKGFLKHDHFACKAT